MGKHHCIECGKLSVIHGQKLCSNCYHKLGVNSVKVACAGCGRTRPHYAKHLCKSCYNKRISLEIRKRDPSKFRQKMSKYQHDRRSKLRQASRV